MTLAVHDVLVGAELHDLDKRGVVIVSTLVHRQGQSLTQEVA